VVAGVVNVGNDAVVSANSLLVRDAPARGVMIGVPARLVSRQGSFTQITYRTMESDDERKLALADLETDSKPAP
jgi:serine O-acetyltransferase